MHKLLSGLSASFVMIVGLAMPVHGAQLASRTNGLAINPAYAIGKWTVTKVGTPPDAVVAALVDNDPSYMGAILSFSADAITWDASKTNKKGTYDNCSNPGYGPSRDGQGFYAIKCGNDVWGFGVTFKVVNQNTMLLKWYDNGILTLTRQDQSH
jgi:hypothetical protein